MTLHHPADGAYTIADDIHLAGVARGDTLHDALPAALSIARQWHCHLDLTALAARQPRHWVLDDCTDPDCESAEWGDTCPGHMRRTRADTPGAWLGYDVHHPGAGTCHIALIDRDDHTAYWGNR